MGTLNISLVTFGGIMGSNALRFLSGANKAYSMRTTSATHRSILN